MSDTPATQAYSVAETEHRVLLNEVVATTTSGVVDVGKYSTIGLQLIASSVSSGNGVFTVNISNDGTNYKVYSGLITNATGRTVAASATLNSNTNDFVWIDCNDAFRYMTVTVTRTTDGKYSAIMCAKT